MLSFYMFWWFYVCLVRFYFVAWIHCIFDVLVLLVGFVCFAFYGVGVCLIVLLLRGLFFVIVRVFVFLGALSVLCSVCCEFFSFFFFGRGFAVGNFL